MAGITDWIFREFCFDKGCDMAFTEMLSSVGYTLNTKNNQAQNNILKTYKNEKKTWVQLFGSDDKNISLAIEKLDKEKHIFYGFDINMGCPAKKIVSKGEGASLMKSPKLAEKMVTRACKTTLKPVSVKMRLGWDLNDINVVEFALRMQEAGVSHISIHGRTCSQGYSGRANWEKIGKVKQKLSIPVYLNGDVVDVSSAKRAYKTTNCDGLMIGRAAMGNPWIFEEIQAYFKDKNYTAPTLNDRIELALKHAYKMVKWKGERLGVIEMRKHLSWYIAGYKNAARIREKINQSRYMEDIEMIFHEYKEFLKE